VASWEFWADDLERSPTEVHVAAMDESPWEVIRQAVRRLGFELEAPEPLGQHRFDLREPEKGTDPTP
jgi:hypothetical protein